MNEADFKIYKEGYVDCNNMWLGRIKHLFDHAVSTSKKVAMYDDVPLKNEEVMLTEEEMAEWMEPRE